MGNEISEVINVLCEKLGTTGQYLIPELMRMNIVEDIIWGIVSLIIIIVSIYFLPKAWKYDKKEYTFWVIVPIISIAVFGVIFIVMLNDMIGWIVSPTAKTVSYIINAMRPIE